MVVHAHATPNYLIGEVLIVDAGGSFAHVSKDLMVRTRFGLVLTIQFSQVLFELVVDTIPFQFHAGYLLLGGYPPPCCWTGNS